MTSSWYFQSSRVPTDTTFWCPPVPLTPASAKPLENLRLAWTSDVGGLAVTADTSRLLASLIACLAERGCETEERALPFDLDAAWRIGGALTTAMAVPVVPAPLRWLGATLYPLMFPNQPFHAGIAKALRMGISGYMKTLTEREPLSPRWRLCSITAMHSSAL